MRRVLKTMEILGFVVVREAEHIALQRQNADGTHTPMTLPNHRRIKPATLRAVCTQCGLTREEFLQAYNQAK